MGKSSILWINSVIAFAVQLSLSQATPLHRDVKNHFKLHTVKIYYENECPANEVPYRINDSWTDYICDCSVYAMYFPSTDSCHPAFTQGPCPEHHYMNINDRNETICTKNPCTEKDHIPYKGHCQKLGTEGGACPSDQILDFVVEIFKLGCFYENVGGSANIIDPLCRKNGRRDQNGLCRIRV